MFSYQSNEDISFVSVEFALHLFNFQFIILSILHNTILIYYHPFEFQIFDKSLLLDHIEFFSTTQNKEK